MNNRSKSQILLLTKTIFIALSILLAIFVVTFNSTSNFASRQIKTIAFLLNIDDQTLASNIISLLGM